MLCRMFVNYQNLSEVCAKAWKKTLELFKLFRLLGMKIGKAKKVFRINSEVIE